MTPLFSIITVTYNAEDTIKRTLDSVASQTCRLYEHIIMDGESTDLTFSIVENYPNDRIEALRRKDEGVYHAMNNGLSVAHGDYVIFLNSGDTFHSPDTLQTLADAIMANDYPGVVYGQTDIVDANGKYLGPRHLRAPEELTLDSFKQGMVVCHQAFCVLRRICEYFNLNYRYSSDYEWCIISLQHSRRNVYVPQVLVDYLSEGLTTKHHKESLRERFKIMATYFGWPTALWQHFKFIFRYWKRRKNAPNIQ